MKRDDEIKIKVISSISDEHIGEVDGERAAAKKIVARKRRAFLRLCAVAVSVVLVISAMLPILIRLLGENSGNGGSGVISDGSVPVYTGMTVSNTYTAAEGINFGISSSAHKVKQGKKLPPISVALEDRYGGEDSEDVYAADPNSDVYITVHLNNPHNFEILSFTLNGQKYSSYMFEEGSNMENLVLKVNVGEEIGVRSYTIDAIKYVEGEKIKDVRMDGERTVEVCVRNTNVPRATRYALSVGRTTYSAEVGISDPYEAVALGEGEVYAVVYDGENIIREQRLNVLGRELAKTTMEFVDLPRESSFIFAVVAVYDAYDGKGKSPHLLEEWEFDNYTAIEIGFAGFIGDTNDATFWIDDAYFNYVSDLTKMEILNADGETVWERPYPADIIENLPPGKLYLRYTYNYGEEDIVVTSEPFYAVVGMSPVEGEISAHYSASHPGVDIVPTTDDLRVYSVSAGGTVIDVIEDASGNKIVEVECETYRFKDQIGYKNVIFRYESLDEVFVEVDDRLEGGQIIGTVGDNTAGGEHTDMTSGKHLHYEIYYIDDYGNKLYIVPEFDTAPELDAGD